LLSRRACNATHPYATIDTSRYKAESATAPDLRDIPQMVSRRREQLSIPRAKQLRAAMTNAEVILWSRLRRAQLRGLHFRRQHPIGPYVADFACRRAMLVVEVDGETHHTPEQVTHDARRRWYLEQRGWCEMRVANQDVYRHLDEVIESIWRNADRQRR
jgi:very-short-patch-repair endonuclease